MRVVVLILDGIAKDPCGGVMKLSEDIGYYNEVDPILVRQWALTFIQNGGTFNNHSYKKREPAGVITDPAARGDMKRWMMLASRAKPPATAKDFMGFVNAEYNTNIKERTAQIWLHLIGFKWRGAQSLEIQAESWIKKHRSHRGHSGTMDEKLYELYFPYGVDNDEHINDDELALHDNMIEYINDNVTHDDELDTWLNMLDNYQRSGRII